MKTINTFSGKLFALTLALMASVSTFAYDFQDGYLFYNILADGTVAVTNERLGLPYNNLPASLVIPSEVTGNYGAKYQVSEIANYAFQGCDKLESLVIPNTVKKIGIYAFTGCSKLLNISFPESLEDVMGGALYECAWYDNQPDGLVYVGNLLYRYKGIAPTGVITINEGTKAVLGLAFSNQPNITSVILPESVTSVHMQAFGDCPNLESVILPTWLSVIEDYTFQNCSKLQNINLPLGLDQIGKEAFAGCSSLTILDWPLQLKNIGARAFYNCNQLDGIENISPNIEKIGADAFGNTAWESKQPSGYLYIHNIFYAYTGEVTDSMHIEIRKGTTYISGGAVSRCVTKINEYSTKNVVSKITIPNSVTEIEDETFRSCRNLDTIICTSVKPPLISENTFNLTLQKNKHVLLVPTKALDIYSWMGLLPYEAAPYWNNFTNVKPITDPYVYDPMYFEKDSIQYHITNDTLAPYEVEVTHWYGLEQWDMEGHNYPELTTADIPASVTYKGTTYLVTRVGKMAFYHALHLQHVTIGENVKIIDEQAFAVCRNLSQVVIGENVDSILLNAFASGTSKIKVLDIPKNVKFIENKSLSAYSLEAINVHPDNANYTSVDGVLFNKQKNYLQEFPRSKATTYMIPDCVDTIGNLAFASNHNIVSISFSPNSQLKHIEKEAFMGCVFMQRLDLPASLQSIEERAFNGCSSLEAITSLNPTPPVMSAWYSYNEQVFGSVSHDIPLFVPAESVEAYKTAAQWKEFGQILPIEQTPEDLFPTLWGLQRTGCTKTIGENGNGTTVWGSRSYLMQEIETTTIDGKQYLLFGTNNIYDEYCSLWLREENNKILVYSAAQKKDLVLYDFTLNVGDSLPRLYVDEELSSIVDYFKYEADWEYTKPLFVTEVSTITLLDGKEYKKWTFDNGIEYVEGIGSFGSNYGHNDFYQLIVNAPRLSDVYSQHLVCVSKNGQLLYQMDDAEMEQLETECLCEIEPKWSETWCNQWNILSHGYLGPQDPLAGARTSIYWLSNNTVNRNGQEYIPLMCSSSLPNEESTHLVGELRFTEDKQVYFYYAFDETEYLLYDFGAELGDTLELFAGLEFYNYHKTYTHVITDKETLDDGRLQIQADVVIRIDNGAGEYFEEKHPVTWIEGLGSTYGIIFNPSNPGVCGDGAIIMLCAYRDDECVYTTNFSDYKNMGCVYNNDGTVDEDLFPMLAGLQRTVCNEYCEDSKTSLQKFEEIRFEHDQPYIYCYSAFLIREENNKILIYSHSLDKDLVLYDFTLEVGDSLPQLYLDEEAKKDIYWIYYEYMNVVDYNKYNDSIYPADTLIVTDVSMITLLDGKEYKKWTFNNGMEYVEGIGMYGGRRGGNFFGLIQEVVVPCHIGTHLVCASRNGKLLYQMDDAEMERLGTECLCEVETSYKSQWCDTWNVMWFDGMRFDETASTSQYRLGKDTIIGDYTYSKFTSRTSVRFTSDRKVYVYYEGFDDNDPYTPDLPTGEYLAYDFSAQVGDTLEVFSGSHSYTTEQCVVYDVQTDPETNLRTIMLHPLCVVDGDGNVGVSDEEIIWIEGVGSPEGFLMSYLSCGWVGGGTSALLCAYKGDELKYTGPLYEEYGCEYNATEQNPEDLFPTLWGLQRTSFTEYSECSDSYALLFQSKGETITINHNQYLKFGGHYLREENKQVLLYSRLQDKDLVLYDYSLEVGDTLTTLNIDYRREGIPFDLCYVDYAYEEVGMSHSIDTLIVTDISYVTLLDGKEHKQWTFDNGMQYVEGIGNFGQSRWSGDFFGLVKEPAIPTCLMGEHLVCISKNGKLLYQMDDEEMERLGTECLCEAETPEDLFPTLWGLQRTSCSEYVDCQENETYLMQADEIKEINGKQYLKYGGVFLREEDSKVLIYSFPYEKDFVLYDWTLEIGDTLQILGIDPFSFPELEYTAVVDYVAFEEYDANGNRTIVKKPLGNKRVKDISTMRLLDGNEYKAWLFGYDWERGNYYVEGIGNASKYGGDYVDLVCPFEVPSCYYGERLVCVSRDGVLLYQMDEEEMERLGAECLCDYTSGPKKDNAKDGQIGGRPTPTQWNMLEMELRKMENGVTILQAETFSYILEDISQQVNNKTYFQLTRQSTKDTATTKSVVGALHFGKDEDNRVYFLRDGVEYVLYDFTAEPGDTVEIFAGVNNYPQETTYTHVVTGKDTLENGACRMILEVVFPDETTTAENAEKVWLAGLGSIDGIVHNAASRASNARSSETQTSVMLCAWRDDDCLYTTDHPDYDTLGCVYNTESTGVGNTTSSTSYQKILRNGQLLILHQGRIYNVMGVEMK